MRNLKKALALVMVFALVLGTVASAASFSDVDSDYAYVEEVELLADLGVLAGFPDGTYQPEATITRVQAAAVIYRILTGRQSAAMYDGATKFYDVAATYWGTGYINYCADIGAIGGYPDGSFRPDQAITVAEYESMLVRALGLTEGRTLSYPNGYLALADANLINEDVPSSIAANSAADRGLVSKLTYNTITNATYQTLATRDEPDPKIIEKIFKIVPYEGVITATRYEGINGVGTGSADKFTFDDNLAADKTKDGTYKFAKVTADMIGQTVKMYLKTGAANDTSVYAVVPTSDNKVVTVANGNFSNDLDGKGPYYKVDGVKYYVTLPAAAYTYLNGEPLTSDPTTFQDITTKTSPATTAMGKNILRSITLISNDGSDSSVEYVFAKTYKYTEYQQTANDKIYTKDVLVELKSNSNDIYDVSVDDGIVAGDKVIVYQNNDKNVAQILKADVVEATLDGKTGGSTAGDLKYTFNGATKSTVVGTSSPWSTTDAAKKLESAENLGNAGKFIVAPFFGLVLETSQGVASVSNYYYVKDTALGSGFDALKNIVKVVNTKGETLQLKFKTGTLLNGSGTDLSASTTDITGMEGQVYVMSVNSSNEITSVKTPDTYDSTGIAAVKADTATTGYFANLAAWPDGVATTNVDKNPYSESSKLLEVAGQPSGTVTLKVDDSSVFFIEDSKHDVYVYVGTFPATAAKNLQMKTAYTKLNDVYNTVRAAALQAYNKPVPSTDVYGFLTNGGDIASSSSGMAYATFKIAMGGEVKTLATTDVAYSDVDSLLTFANGGSVAKGSLVSFSLTSDGKIALDSAKNALTQLVSKGATITDIDGGATYRYGLSDTEGNIGYVADFSGNVLAITNVGLSTNAAANTKLFKVADDVKVYEIASDSVATVSARGAVQVIKNITNTFRTKVLFVYDISSNDTAMQKVTEIYVIK